MFSITKNVNAQAGNCAVSGINRTYMGVIIRDEFGNHWGRESVNSQDDMCIPPERRQSNIIRRVNDPNNWLDSHANGIIQKCDNDDGLGGGGFEIRTYRCPPNPSMRLMFDIQPPPAYNCANVTWELVVRDDDEGYPVGTVLQSGTGCRVSVPPPLDEDHNTQVIVNLNPPATPTPQPNHLPLPGGLRRTCNGDGTATFRWDPVSEAGEYGFRLDNQSSPSNPLYNWYDYVDSNNDGVDDDGIQDDLVLKGSQRSVTVPITYGTQYQWAVTAVRNPGSEHPFPTWSPAFTCPPLTPTPYINIRTRSPAGTAVTVPQMAFTYECGTNPICFSTIYNNRSSVSTRTISGWEGGGGIVLNSNQRIVGVTPNPGGGVRRSIWRSSTNSTWENYWWPSYPNSGTRSLDFIVATITNTPIPPTPTCSPVGAPSITNPSGTITSGTQNITWNSVSGASGYALRVDDLSNGQHANPCSSGAGDMCRNLSGAGNTSYSYDFIAGRSYRIWVHAVSACSGAMGPANPVTNVSVPPPTATPTPIRPDLDPPDLAPTNRTTTEYRIPVCNRGPGGASSQTYTVRITNTLNNRSQNRTMTVPVIGTTNCPVVTIPCQQLGDEFGGEVCNTETNITVTVDIGNVINETNETNNTTTNNVFTAIASEPFYKLKDAALHRQGYVDVGISNPLGGYDSSDPVVSGTAEQFLIIGAAGVATSTDEIRIISGTGKVSNNNYRKNTYENFIIDSGAYGYLADLDSFKNYINAQKSVKTITAYNSTQIDPNQVHYREGLLNVASNLTASADNNFIIFVDGDVNINTIPTLNTSGASMAIISTGKITIHQNITEINAILIANEIDLGTSSNRLKINGNLISNNYLEVTREVTSNPQRPNLYVVFNPKMYMDLLPHLSDITLEGRQVQ